jgi:predicted AAA+ superfamily ATPase
MRRFLYNSLIQWKNSNGRKPLILRGARQVGKTHVVRQLAQDFTYFIEINFEFLTAAEKIFVNDLDPKRITREIELLTGQKIIPGETLLFLDEIQVVPQAITALRYFYELMPELHVIAAGSLLDFVLQEVGMPVGRVSFLYCYPMSFLEFLWANEQNLLVDEILNHQVDQALSTPLHNKLMDYLACYLVVGGMPEAITKWLETRDLSQVSDVHYELIASYRQDFHKYAKHHQIKYLDVLFNNVPRQMSQLFKYASIPGDFRKRELAPSLEMLIKAGVVHPVWQSAGQGVPLAAQMNINKFKLILLDVALAQAALGLQVSDWLLDSRKALSNHGNIVEAFVGQELLAYANPKQPQGLFYWQREARSSSAEVDYLIQQKSQVIPIEVKSGTGTHLKSLHLFMQSHTQSPYAIRVSAHNYSIFDNVHSYPLYAIAKIFN